MALLAQDSAVPCALVALTVFRAPAWACLICFTSYKERTRICQIFAGIQGPELEKCQEAFSSAFADLADIEINYNERSHLHDAFTQMTHSLQEIAAAQAQACVPPCGFQDVARRFLCYGCYSKACNFPLDCPGERRGLEGEEMDLTVTRGQQAKFSCTVNFQLPKEEITYSWKFAGGVTSAPPRGEIELQVSFRKVLRWAPKETETLEPWRPSLGELLARPEALTPGNQCLLAALAAVASASATLMVW
ncbi:sperm acrosome membrane-associated protein 6 isoform X1 [Prionailurus iriomotensis]